MKMIQQKEVFVRSVKHKTESKLSCYNYRTISVFVVS